MIQSLQRYSLLSAKSRISQYSIQSEQSTAWTDPQKGSHFFLPFPVRFLSQDILRGTRPTPTINLAQIFCLLTQLVGGRDSSAGIATAYGLDGPGIESQWRQDFPHPSRAALGPIQPPIQWVPGLSRRESGRGVALNTHPHLAPRLKEE